MALRFRNHTTPNIVSNVPTRWGEFAYNGRAQLPIRRVDAEQRVIESLMPGQSKTISVPMEEASGTSVRVGEYAPFDDDYRSLGPARLTHSAYSDRMAGVEVVEWGKARAEMEAEMSPTYNPLKSKTIHSRRDDKFHRLAADEAGEMDANRDDDDIRHIETDPDGWKNGREEIGSQREGPLGRVSRFLSVILNPWGNSDSHSTEGGPVERFTPGCVHYAGDVEGMTSRELATTLSISPTESLRRFYSDDPVAGEKVRGMLEEISRGKGDLTETEARVIEAVIHQSLAGMERYGEFDPRMMEFVVPNDPKYVASGNIRRRLNEVTRILCDENVIPNLPSEVEVQRIIFPLVIHMEERQLPMTVENVEGELDAMIDSLRVIDSKINQAGLSGMTVESLETMLTPEDEEVLSSYSGRVIEALISSHSLPLRVDPALYPENDGKMLVVSTASGPKGTWVRPISDTPIGNYRGVYRDRETRSGERSDPRQRPLDERLLYEGSVPEHLITHRGVGRARYGGSK